MTRARPPAGFTLLEVLVALVVLGFVLAGLAQAVQFGLRAWDTQTNTISGYADLDVADRMLREFVAQIDPGTAQQPPALAGSASTFAFTTDLGRAAAALGVHDADVALLVERGSLVMRWTPSVRGVPLGPLPPPQTTVLAPGVARVEFAYWGRGEGGGGTWLSAWSAQDLPQLVRIRLVFAAGQHRRWPEIVAPTMRLRPPG